MAISDEDVLRQFQVLSEAVEAQGNALKAALEQIQVLAQATQAYISPELKTVVAFNGMLVGALQAKNLLTAEEAQLLHDESVKLMGEEHQARAEAILGLIQNISRAVQGQ